MHRETQTVVVAGWIGSTNLGDELVFEALRHKLALHGLTPVALSRSRDAAVERAISRASPAIVPTVRRAAGLVLGGGGLLQDETSPFNLPYHLSPVLVARLNATPFAGIGLGAGPLTTSWGRRMVRAALAPAVAVSVRDEGSASLLRSVGLPGPTVSADLALSLPLPQVEVHDRLTVSLRPWRRRRSLAPVGRSGSRHEIPPWFLDGMASALDACARSTGLRVHFVAFQHDRDDAVHREIAARMRTDVSFALPGPAEVIGEVAGGQAVIAMRYHAGIAAVLGGRPAALIGYSSKVPALASDVGPAAASVTWSPAEIARLPDVVASLLGKHEEMVDARERLRSRERGNDDVLERLLSAPRSMKRSSP